MAVQLGVVFPTTDIGADPVAIRDYVQGVEEQGWSHLVAYDHVVGAEHADRTPPLWGPYTERDPFHEPMVLFGYIAGITRTLGMAAGVLVLPQRQAVLVAKQAAQVAVLSDNRLRLGVGTGWNWVEYEALGTDFATRGARLDEQVEVMRRLWSEDLVSFQGRFHAFERANILPRPTRPVPVWFGGSGGVALRRAARTGDGFIFGHSGPKAIAAIAALREQLVANGRDPETFGTEGLADWGHGPEATRAAAEAWADAGGTHFSVRTHDTAAEFMRTPRLGFTRVDQHLAALERARTLLADLVV